MYMCQEIGVPGFTQQTLLKLSHTQGDVISNWPIVHCFLPPHTKNILTHAHGTATSAASFPSSTLPFVALCMCVSSGERKALGDIKQGGVSRINRVLSTKDALQTLHSVHRPRINCVYQSTETTERGRQTLSERENEW